MNEPEESGAEPAYGPGQSPFRHKVKKPVIQRTFPVSEHLSTYRRRPFLRDAVAGLTVGALAIPSAMAYAQLIGVPPVYGLYVLLLPLVAYAALGSSRQVIIGPEAGISGMLGAALVGLGAGDPSKLVALASFTALMVGGLFLAARLFRLGWIADYFSRAVLVGYLHGIVFVLVVAQLGKLVGLPAGAKGALPQLAYFVTHLGDIEPASFVVGVSSMVAVLLLKRFLPRWPGALIVVVAGIIVSAAADLQAHGVAVVGTIPSGLPSVTIPSVSGTDIRHLLPVAIGVFLVSFCDSILTARSFAGLHNQNIDANQELTALGVANLVSGVTQGFTPSASGSRTAVNDQMGARTQVAGFVSVVLVAIVLVFFTTPMEYLPTPLLGALIVTAALSIVDPDAWRSLAASGRVPVIIAAITTIGVILFGILPALGVAVGLSILEIVVRGARPHDAVLGYVPRIERYGDVRFHKTAVVTPGVVVYRLDDRIFFANMRYVTGRINEAIDGAPTTTRVVVFDAERVPGIDATAIQALQQLIRSLRERGIEFVVARAGREVIAHLERTGTAALMGENHIQPTVHAAVAASYEPPK